MATFGQNPTSCRHSCFYPRHPRGWRHEFLKLHPDAMMFLSTPPSRVATADIVAKDESPKEFLSTPPSRVATFASSAMRSIASLVSIHATLAGGDPASASRSNIRSMFLSTPPSRVATRRPKGTGRHQERFYPRHPRGWRQIQGRCLRQWALFLSTPPSRVATNCIAGYADIL